MRRLSPARLLLSLIVLSWAACAGAKPSLARGALRYDLRGEIGGEYDSNAHRSEIVSGADNPPAVRSPLTRAAIGAHLSDQIADAQQVSASVMLAEKRFTAPAARSENVAIAQTSALWRMAIDDRTLIDAQALYYEAFQPSGADPATAAERRDFRSLTPQLHLERRFGDATALIAGVGYRWFVFKSNLDFDFVAPSGSLDLRWTRESSDGGADWEIAAGSAVELRAFEGRTIPAPDTATSIGAGGSATGTPSTLPVRRDRFLVNHVDLTRVGAVLFGVGYALHWNGSNSYGETLTRHLAVVRLTAPLPLGVYLAARAELILASYRDGVAVGQIATTGRLLSIDDENRSSLRVDLSRALSDRLLLLLRYTFYANELGVSSPTARYQRQTALLSLAFTLEK